MPRDPVVVIQQAYPQIYLACHVGHVRAKSTARQISAHDSSLLAHLDRTTPMLAGDLARHLGIAASSLSAAIQRLERLGYLERRPAKKDRRAVELRLTEKGVAARADTSVLNSARLAGVLQELTPAERRRAVAGLELLGKAAQSFQRRNPQRRPRG